MAATWEEWARAYEAAYVSLPNDLGAACPNCGHHELHLVFTGHEATRVGWAAFWCAHCLHGITMSRVPIPDGAIIRAIELPPEQRQPQIPDFIIVE